MTICCRYHPTKPAAFECSECDMTLCPDCIIRREVNQYGFKKNIYLCPRCSKETQWMGASNLIQPFWNRFPSFFAYPFSPGPLLLNVALSAAMVIFSGPSFLSGLIRFILWGIWLKYSFSALESTAKGNLHPPKVNPKTVSSGFSIVFKQLGLYMVLFFVYFYLGYRFGPVVTLIYSIGVILLLPSMIIVLVTTESFFQALNPVLFTRLAFRIGRAYFLLFFFLFLLLAAPGAAFHFGSHLIPGAMAPFVMFFFRNYYTLISYHLMGYVLLQYHEDIGYEVEFDAVMETGNRKENHAGVISPLLAETDILLKDGKYDQAFEVIEKDMQDQENSDILVHERYYRLLKLKNQTAKMVQEGILYLDLLVKAGEKSKAGQVYLECLKTGQPFLLPSGTLLKTGSWLKGLGQYQAALHAFNTFVKSYPKDPMCIMAYFRAAEIFNENLSQKKKAGSILRGILKKYPDHDMVPFIQKYLQTVTS